MGIISIQVILKSLRMDVIRRERQEGGREREGENKRSRTELWSTTTGLGNEEESVRKGQ